jgi:hypothetical protein
MTGWVHLKKEIQLQYPHCDMRVLHAPGECEFCDQCPEWQELRKGWGISFSGHEPTDEQPNCCPADVAVLWHERGDYNQWGGNRPSGYQDLSAL